MAILEATGADNDKVWVNLPDSSLVSAKFVSFEETEFTYTDKDTGQPAVAERWTWFFEVIEPGEFNSRRLRGQTSRNFTVHENCKAMQWANALVDRQIEEGEKLDPETLYGTQCRIVTEQSAPDAQGRIWDNVVDVLPAPSRTTAAEVFG
jgi:hypothetical protein